MNNPGIRLSDAVALFDRKERSQVVRFALGERSEELDGRFCKEVSRALRGSVQLLPERTRWFTDFHFDWLVGALTVHARSEAVCLAAKPDENPGFASPYALVRGDQSDIDLLLVQDSDLILIEAKWFGAWDDKQLESKLKRFEAIKCWTRNTLKSSVRTKFLLLSPDCVPSRTRETWEKHTCEPLSRIPLLPTCRRGHALRVSRCHQQSDGTSRRARTGRQWRIERVSMPGQGGPDEEADRKGSK